MVGSPRPFETGALLSSATAPVPTSATYSTSTGAVVVAFDQPLTAGTTAVLNWIGVKGGFPVAAAKFTPAAPWTIFGSQVGGASVLGASDVDPPRITYAASPADVLGATGIPVAPFANFPVTMIP